MKIDVFSDVRVPTLPRGGHGLGRVAIDIVNGLSARGHDVRLFAGKGSESIVPLCIHDDEQTRAETYDGGADVVIDASHWHTLSQVQPERAVINCIMDFECPYAAPRAIIFNDGHRAAHPTARIVPLGVDVDAVPMGAGGQHLVFCAKLHAMKGIDIAMDVAEQSRYPLAIAGQSFTVPPARGYVGELTDDAALYAFLGSAYAHLAPYRYDAGSRVVLDAAATGTPTLCLDRTATQYHVEHGISGFVCGTTAELIDALNDVPSLDRAVCREWAHETHDIRLMIDGLEQAAQAALEGKDW